ncbi:MAG: recombinase RecA [Bacteroidetes bacterium QS_8_68_28]|jgi:recombination protein RecA|nr:MAG: recombinase RecA [Bacteroidetes bacterium QS_8_68_28]
MADENGEAKDKALSAAVDQIQREFGKGSIMRLGDEPVQQIESIPTGSLTLDKALGIGGVPRGRIMEIYGPESSGKTTLASHIIAEAQKMGGSCAFIDAEHAFDPNYAGDLGVDIDELLVSQPDTGEQALSICDTLVRSGALDVIVIDSVSALVPQAELEGDMGDTHVGLQARLMSQALRKLAGTINRTKTALIFINQIRMKIGVRFGSPETTSGGRALKFYCSVRMDIRRIGAVKDGSDVIGNKTRVRVKKNKVAPPFKDAEFDIIYGEGISALGELIDLGTEYDIIEKRGSWYSYDGDTIAQGREATKEWLEENDEVRQHVKYLIRKELGMVSEEEQIEVEGEESLEEEEAEGEGVAEEA